MHNKKQSRLKRHRRILLSLRGTPERPRLMLRPSLKHCQAQAVDDQAGKVIISVSTADKALRGEFGSGTGNIKAASALGGICARRLKEKGISRIVFDRGGYLYHGRIKAFAEALRKAGMEF